MAKVIDQKVGMWPRDKMRAVATAPRPNAPAHNNEGIELALVQPGDQQQAAATASVKALTTRRVLWVEGALLRRTSWALF